MTISNITSLSKKDKSTSNNKNKNKDRNKNKNKDRNKNKNKDRNYNNTNNYYNSMDKYELSNYINISKYK
tara:strand:+ start:296 stop:505 length:210 start_codon:yes stop_codon:yes gene_type:complete